MEGNYYAGLIEFNATLVMNWVTVLVLFFILKKFFFEKVYNFILARENSIKNVYEKAETVSREADEKLITYNKRIADVENEGREIIKNAKAKADKQANDIIDGAHKKAEEMIGNAKNEIEREKVRVIADMKEQIIMLSLMAAEKVMEKELEVKGQEEFVDKILEQAGTATWRN